ncbi:DUF6289 family protein [Marilutibacter alkalisoli]|uniref:Uncharacterized protein n=1 Tax=Marilutibacter alkalisoli TaxID=2591633 RepID=A0A514BQA4_9GAMM|nr:DUF6289 family protein [Lysobacter alkalisoli]QDH69582.1 hypothetical protein FKV23_05355 [Lysobacter alkalisoli]
MIDVAIQESEWQQLSRTVAGLTEPVSILHTMATRTECRANQGEQKMRRIKVVAAAMVVGLLAAYSLTALASWQGTWNYYDEEGVLVGQWTAGCGDADGRWGMETSNKWFSQGCAVDM